MTETTNAMTTRVEETSSRAISLDTLAHVEALNRGRSGFGHALRREFHQNKLFLVCAIYIALVVVLALTAPLIAPYSPDSQDLYTRLTTPSRDHWLGTDEVGRDTLSRMLYGGRVSLLIAFMSTLGSVSVGTAVGLISGYFGGRTDELVMRFLDMLYAFPGVLLAILIVSVLGASTINLVIALVIWGAPTLARIVRSSVLSLKRQEFVEAAHALGAGAPRILTFHLLINCSAPIIVYSSLSFAGSLLTAASLGFLGLGAQPPTPEWGAMLSDARKYLLNAPHLGIYPGVAIFLTVLSFNVMGDAIRDALDPFTPKLASS